jgi:hypothetical protein
MSPKPSKALLHEMALRGRCWDADFPSMGNQLTCRSLARTLSQIVSTCICQWIFFFLRQGIYVAQAGLDLTIPLPQLSVMELQA